MSLAYRRNGARGCSVASRLRSMSLARRWLFWTLTRPRRLPARAQWPVSMDGIRSGRASSRAGSAPTGGSRSSDPARGAPGVEIANPPAAQVAVQWRPSPCTCASCAKGEGDAACGRKSRRERRAELLPLPVRVQVALLPAHDLHPAHIACRLAISLCVQPSRLSKPCRLRLTDGCQVLFTAPPTPLYHAV